MKIVIIEDEIYAAMRLENMIREYDSSIEIVAKLESVKESIDWFTNNQQPDLIFLDIHLEDNLSFAIFKSVKIACHIVFTTATDELATRAFALMNIDYLLKPIMQTELKKIIEKYRKLPVSEKNVIHPDTFDEIVKERTNN